MNEEGDMKKGNLLKTNKVTQGLMLLLGMVLLVGAVCRTGSADIGPKPSVHITFENLGDELCYGTLLSLYESTGPASAWDGREESAIHNENPNGQYSYLDYGYDVWKAFVDYDEQDEYYFLQTVYRVDETKSIHWGYYPPEQFKILLYFPETGEYAVSEVMKRYAFDSYFEVNMDGVGLSAAYDEVNSTDARFLADKNYRFRTELLGFAARVVLTILIELLLAPFFGYVSKKQLGIIAGANVCSQLLLNIVLQLIWYYDGATSFVLAYFLLELLVFTVEALIYTKKLPTSGTRTTTGSRAVGYAFVANAVSLAVGLGIAEMIPQIF